MPLPQANNHDFEMPPRDDGLDPAKSHEQRIREYRLDALRRRDPLAANLGAINAGLMDVAVRLYQHVDEALSSPAESFGLSCEARQLLEMHLKVVRQVDRLARLERQAGKTNRAAGERSERESEV